MTLNTSNASNLIELSTGPNALKALSLGNAAVNPILTKIDTRVIDSWAPPCSETYCTALHNSDVYYFGNNH